jgi:hypothetical protein
MAPRLYHVVIDCHDPGSLARFWAAAPEREVDRLIDLGASRVDVERC